MDDGGILWPAGAAMRNAAWSSTWGRTGQSKQPTERLGYEDVTDLCANSKAFSEADSYDNLIIPNPDPLDNICESDTFDNLIIPNTASFDNIFIRLF